MKRIDFQRKHFNEMFLVQFIVSSSKLFEISFYNPKFASPSFQIANFSLLNSMEWRESGFIKGIYCCRFHCSSRLEIRQLGTSISNRCFLLLLVNWMYVLRENHRLRDIVSGVENECFISSLKISRTIPK